MVVKEHITDLFFDLDHTIYDFDKNSALTFEAVFKELNIESNLIIHLIKNIKALHL